jgi:hypothetical protein
MRQNDSFHEEYRHESCSGRHALNTKRHYAEKWISCIENICTKSAGKKTVSFNSPT